MEAKPAELENLSARIKGEFAGRAGWHIAVGVACFTGRSYQSLLRWGGQGGQSTWSGRTCSLGFLPSPLLLPSSAPQQACVWLLGPLHSCTDFWSCDFNCDLIPLHGIEGLYVLTTNGTGLVLLRRPPLLVPVGFSRVVRRSRPFPYTTWRRR